MGRKSDYSEEVTTYDRDGIGSIALWKNEKESEKQPKYTGTVSFRDVKKKFKIAVWIRKDKQEPKDTIPKFCYP